MQDQIDELKSRIESLERATSLRDSFSNLEVFRKQVNFLSSVNLNGTTQLSGNVGFFNKTPIAQPSAINSPTGGATVDSQARNAIISVITVLHNLGLTA